MFEVIRVEKTKDYTVISNRHLKDTELSLKAKGLMTVMLALPNESWDLTIEGLATVCKDGRSAIASALKELERCGYFSKRKARDDKGKIVGWVHTLTEMPQSDFPQLDNPHMENPVVENPVVENRTQLNTYQSSTNKSNTYQSNTYKVHPSRFVPPTLEEVQDYCNQRGNNVDAEQFIDHYEARNWRFKGGDRVKDWKACVRTWERNNFNGSKPQSQLQSIFDA